MAVAQGQHPDDQKNSEDLVLEVELPEEALDLLVEELEVDQHGREETQADDHVIGDGDFPALVEVVQQ